MMLFKNATFVSCEDENKVFSVMGVDKGKIICCADEIPDTFKNSPTIDLKGKCVLPAFADTHIHFESFALFNATIDVRDAKNFKDMAKIYSKYEKANPKVKFIPAFGCCAHTVEEKRLPNKDDLDKITSLPTLIVKYDGHAGVANTALLNQLPKEVIKDEGFDRDTGWMYQNAFYLGVNYITQKVSPLSILSGLISASDFMAKKGIALIHNVEGVGYKNDIDVDTIILAAKALPQTFRIFFQTMDIDKVIKRKLPRIGGCFRLALDGCFGSEDAALLEPYNNDPNNKGFLTYSQEQVNEFCIKANRAGLQISIHGIGDAAVEQALNAYEAALKDYPRKDHRHIIIHANLMSEEMQEKAAQLGVLIATQPAFLYWEHEPQDYLDNLLGKERAAAIMPLKSWIEKGIKVSAGSDSPCTIPNPIEGIHYSCNHPNPNESISVLDALRMHTSWAAYTSFDEKERGMLKEGMIADFVVLDKNPLEVPVNQLKNLNVENIYFAGNKYEKPISGALPLIIKALLTKKK
ncbi:MAG TPA: amidohydrolase [Clostridia bacterium]|nr:amidohydrolase [Clostridia bacterium]